jgi:translin
MGATDFGGELEGIIERIRADLTRKSDIRDRALQRSRSMIRFCANCIRAAHRHEFDHARALLAEAQAAAAEMVGEARTYSDIYYAGYVQDAMKELAEAAIVVAVVTGETYPDPDVLGIEYPAYLNGLGEAAGEMRRFALDSIRRGDVEEAERMLSIMDDIYTHLVTMDFADSMTGGLRRTTDMVRGVTERTRGDLTIAVRQERLQERLQALEKRLDEGR